MTKIGVLNYYEELNNIMFSTKNAPIGDNLLEPLNYLCMECKNNNIELVTPDFIENIDDMDGFIFFDFSEINRKHIQQIFETKVKKILIINESQVILASNWNLENHKYFDKIFTWNDEWVDDKKYFKFNYSYKIPKKINKSCKNKKLCTLIAGNKTSTHELELYSKRIEAIRWFEKYHINDFIYME